MQKRHMTGRLRLATILLASALSMAAAQQTIATVSIRLGALQLECYPSCNHSTEWLRQVYAEVRDTTGVLLTPDSLEFEWAADFCIGNGLQYGYASGIGLHHLAVDGNLVKAAPGCCAVCEFQAYIVGVRVRVDDLWFEAPPVQVPGIVIPSSHALRPNFPNPFNASTKIPFDLARPLT